MSQVPVTICVPVYQAEAFVEETLVSIIEQDFRDFRVLVSVDQSTDDSLEICRGFADDQRVEVVSQPSRLGYVANCNYLIHHVETQYFKFAPHDDVLAPELLGRLLGVMEDEPDCAVAYCDLIGFGQGAMNLRMPEVRGDVCRRFLDFILNQRTAAAFHGLVRLPSEPSTLPLLPDSFYNDFEVDVLWLLELLRFGELRRIDSCHVRKRFSQTMTSANWGDFDAATARRLQIQHAVHMTRIAFRSIHEAEDREQIVAAVLGRLYGLGYSYFPQGLGSHLPAYLPLMTKQYFDVLAEVEPESVAAIKGLDLLDRISADRGVIMAAGLSASLQKALRENNQDVADYLTRKVLEMDSLASWPHMMRLELANKFG